MKLLCRILGHLSDEAMAWSYDKTTGKPIMTVWYCKTCDTTTFSRDKHHNE